AVAFHHDGLAHGEGLSLGALHRRLEGLVHGLAFGTGFFPGDDRGLLGWHVSKVGSAIPCVVALSLRVLALAALTPAPPTQYTPRSPRTSPRNPAQRSCPAPFRRR